MSKHADPTHIADEDADSILKFLLTPDTDAQDGDLDSASVTSVSASTHPSTTPTTDTLLLVLQDHDTSAQITTNPSPTDPLHPEFEPNADMKEAARSYARRLAEYHNHHKSYTPTLLFIPPDQSKAARVLQAVSTLGRRKGLLGVIFTESEGDAEQSSPDSKWSRLVLYKGAWVPREFAPDGYSPTLRHDPPSVKRMRFSRIKSPKSSTRSEFEESGLARWKQFSIEVGGRQSNVRGYFVLPCVVDRGSVEY